MRDALHASPHLAARRRKVPAPRPFSVTQKGAYKTHAMLQNARLEAVARARLWLALAFWTIRADVNNSLPPGLEVFAFPDQAWCPASSPTGHQQEALKLECHIAMPAALFFPALDRLYYAYDETRELLWPETDRVAAQRDDATPRGAAAQLADPSARLAASCEALCHFDATVEVLDRLLARDVLSFMPPEALQEWTLLLTRREVRSPNRALIRLKAETIRRQDGVGRAQPHVRCHAERPVTGCGPRCAAACRPRHCQRRC